MVTIGEVAREVSALVPKLISSIKGNLMLSEVVTTQQMITILLLSEIGTSKVSAIAKRMGVSPPTITGIVDRLQKSGYVNRFRDSKDRRVVFVKLTKKGHKFVEKLKKTIQRRWSQILVYLTDEERLAYVKILKKIINVLAKEEVRSF
ncbi:MAG: MarR family transcriptional regulator [Candidatus Omnitrophica bacterium]|nr:MarR family transcriptional regulator [Candidatus Omnitrophota bacterium]